MQICNLTNFLVENFFVAFVMSENHFVVLLTYPALHCIHPVCTLFNLVVAQDTGEDDLVHVACHWILNKEIVGDLINSHEHECKLASWSIFLLLHHFNLCFDPLTLNTELFHLLKDIFLLLRPIDDFLLITKHLEHFFP